MPALNSTAKKRQSKNRTPIGRARQRRLLRFARKAIGLAIIACLIALPALLVSYHKPVMKYFAEQNLFPLRQWKVSGVMNSGENQLCAELDQLLGRPLSSIGDSDLELVLAADPWVRDFRVLRHWPNALELHVREHQVLGFCNTNTGLQAIAQDGRLLPLPGNGPGLDLPLITGLKIQGPEELQELAAALELIRTKAPEVYGRLDQLQWGEFPVLRLGKCTARIRLRRGELEHGLSMLCAVLDDRPELLQQDWELDLRFVNQVVARSEHG